MKQICTSTLIIIFSLNILFSQNTPIQQWYLQYIIKDGVTHPNYYNEDQIMDIVFIETNQSPSSYAYTAVSSCNYVLGTFIAEIDFPFPENTLTFTETNITLIDCDPSTPKSIYESLFIEVFTNNYSETPLPFDYEITTVEDDDTGRNNINSSPPPPPPKLTLTNSFGDKLVYYLTPPYGILVDTWYLSRIEIPGNPTIEIPETHSPSLSLTNNIDPFTFKTMASGNGECNAFEANYGINLTNGNYIQLDNFYATLADCGSNYEGIYFNTLSNLATNTSEYEIRSLGHMLILEDLLGVKLIFGDGLLSVSENDLNTLNISLVSNPVSDIMYLNYDFDIEDHLSYEIYTLTGKLVKKARLQQKSIVVKELSSGLYFVRFSNNDNQSQVVKFIKQ
ncbi:T9SS type A sorting domain-containing protein [Psychroserpens sp. S379A]|uniref:T9SS type A sorting domain-containing protein n=1 Tax=Psychroserpens sp. S379A TaxID=3415137 RepID=UPI003C7A8F31